MSLPYSHLPVRTSIGLGGKTLVDLERPAHLHSSAVFPPHSFRPGDLASIVDHSSGGNGSKGKGKALKEAPTTEGVVWKVLETRIVVALNRGRGGGTDKDGGAKDEDMELPERIRLCVFLQRAYSCRRLTSFAGSRSRTPRRSTAKSNPFVPFTDPYSLRLTTR